MASSEKLAAVGHVAVFAPALAEPQGGKIFLDDRPIIGYDVHHFRRHMAVVARTTCLSSTAMLEDIVYGLPREVREAITDSRLRMH